MLWTASHNFGDDTHDLVSDDGSFSKGVRPSYICKSLPQMRWWSRGPGRHRNFSFGFGMI